MDMSQASITSVSLVISFVLITIMHIVFGELIPKSIAIRKSEATTMATAVPLRVFYTIFKPFIWLMNSMSNGFLRLIKIHPASEQEIHSTEELQLLVKQSADSGEIEEENYEIIKNAFDFTDHSANRSWFQDRILLLSILKKMSMILSIRLWTADIPVFLFILILLTM
jgi:CBS domain containing-hemolysin-like protein